MPPHKKEKQRHTLEVTEEDKSKDVRCGKKCDSVTKEVCIPSKHTKGKHHKVCKTLECDEVQCRDCTVRKGQCPIHVKQRDVKLRVKPEDQWVEGDEFDVYLKKGKAKCNNPEVKVHVAAPEIVWEKQKIDVVVEPHKVKKGKHVVRVHCPKPECHVLEPKVHVDIERHGKVCLPAPEICVRYAKKEKDCDRKEKDHKKSRKCDKKHDDY